MINQLTRTHVRCFASAAIVLTLLGVFIARTALAKLAANTIDPVAVIMDNGRGLLLTGPISCTENERTELRVIVTQRSTGAVAEGRGFVTCTGELQRWEVRASTQGEAVFEEGPAIAVAIARSIDNGRSTDAHQWLVNLTLVKQ